MIEPQKVDSLKSLYHLMAQTRPVRAAIVDRLLASQSHSPQHLEALNNALAALQACCREGHTADLRLEGSARIQVDLAYEITELEKDIFFLENGEAAFETHLQTLHPEFETHVSHSVAQLGGKRFNSFITDRDGTINNYCGRYATSIQPVYNALYVARFARAAAQHPIIITSAPLKNPGIVDVSVMPEKTVIYAASKGREFIDLTGTRRSFPIDAAKQRFLDRLNRRLATLVEKADYERFALIGSGLQMKFGQTTIARQDISGSIPEKASQSFLALIEDITRDIDPSGDNFKIEDTGLDVEIILTVEDQEAGLKDFDKKEAVKFLDRELNLNMATGPHLVCGDTGSDLPMLEASMAYCSDTWAVFVTQNPQLADKVSAVCPQSVIVPQPDMLVAALNQLAQQRF
jgi:hypothetical protein